jgi:putative phosphoesterase
MNIGVVSDTHGQVDSTRQAVRMLESCSVEQVLHCGDIGSPEVVPLFAAWPTHFVFGNVDWPQAPLRDAIAVAGQTCHGAFGSLELGGIKIAFLHGDDERLLQETIQSGQWQLVCHGHTHKVREQRIGATFVLNPGALYRARPHSLALVALPSLEITIVPL